MILQFVDQKIERIGTSWRTTPLQKDIPLVWQASEQQLSDLINQWQSAQLMGVNESVVFNPNAPTNEVYESSRKTQQLFPSFDFSQSESN